MYKNHGTVFRQHEIRFSRQIVAMEAKSETHAVEQRSDCPLRGGVRRADLTHDLASFLFGKRIQGDYL
jgi:hypothetical protein